MIVSISIYSLFVLFVLFVSLIIVALLLLPTIPSDRDTPLYECLPDTFILHLCFQFMYIRNFWGDLTHVLAKTQHRMWAGDMESQTSTRTSSRAPITVETEYNNACQIF